MVSPTLTLWNGVCALLSGLGDAQPLDLLWWAHKH